MPQQCSHLLFLSLYIYNNKCLHKINHKNYNNNNAEASGKIYIYKALCE